MDRWIALHEGATGPKLRLFASLAECDESTALGVLCHIWLWGVRDNVTSSGLMKNTSKEHIKNIFAYTIPKDLDPQKVVDALIESEWIDEIEGSYYIHDWSEHQKPWAQYKAKTEAETERKRKQRLKKKLLSETPDTGQTDEPEEPPPKGDVEPPGDETAGDPPKSPAKAYTPAFEQFWAVYPRKDEKANAYKKYKARLNDGFSEEELLRAAMAYAAQCKKQQTEKCYIKLGKTFLSETTPFVDFLREGDAPGHLPTGGHAGEYHYDPGDTSGSL